MKKKYISELVGNNYKNWNGKKIFLQAPTGFGKTSFIINSILADYYDRGKKLLILCNRRLLREQYWYQLIQHFERYSELKECVQVMTYQELAQRIVKGMAVERILKDFDGICLDEVHYAYSDSDFSGFATYGLFQAIIYAGMSKTMIFISATLECVRKQMCSLIKWNNSWVDKMCRTTGMRGRSFEGCQEIIDLDYNYLADYDYLHCIAVPDWQTLCRHLAEDLGKSIIFVDNKEVANEMKKYLVDECKISSGEVILFNSENIGDEKNDSMVRKMALANLLEPKILITTSVLDNGVSIHDSDVHNICVMTDSKVSFIQMVGRVRAESVDALNLYFVLQDAEFFRKREYAYKEQLELIEQFNSVHRRNERSNREFIHNLWYAAEGIEKLRHLLVPIPDTIEILGKNPVIMDFGGVNIVRNELAYQKIGDSYITAGKLHVLALENPLNVVYEQMLWIGKSKDELEVLPSDYLENKTQELIKILLKVQDYTLQQLGEIKELIACKYRRLLFSDIVVKNNTFSRDKLEQILEQLDLCMLVTKGTDGKKRYTITRKSDNNANLE